MLHRDFFVTKNEINMPSLKLVFFCCAHCNMNWVHPGRRGLVATLTSQLDSDAAARLPLHIGIATTVAPASAAHVYSLCRSVQELTAGPLPCLQLFGGTLDVAEKLNAHAFSVNL